MARRRVTLPSREKYKHCCENKELDGSADEAILRR